MTRKRADARARRAAQFQREGEVRDSFAPWVERGRIEGSETFGSFRLPGPLGITLLVVVGDGKEWALEGEPWEHVSVSTKTRTPTWAEMEFVRDAFFREDETVLQFSVPREKHINIHPHVLHLWRPTRTAIPLPPSVCV